MFEYFGFSLKPYAVFGKVTGKTGNFFFGSILLRTSSFNSSSFFALDSRCPNVFISSEDNPLNWQCFLTLLLNSQPFQPFLNIPINLHLKYLNLELHH